MKFLGLFLRLERRQDHDTISSLEFGGLLYLPPLLRLLYNPHQHVPSHLRVSQLPAPENNGYLGLVSLFQKMLDMPNFELEIMLLRLGSQLHLFQMDNGLLLLRIMGLLLLLVLELSIVHNAANRRLCFWRNFNQVQFKIGSGPKGLHQW